MKAHRTLTLVILYVTTALSISCGRNQPRLRDEYTWVKARASQQQMKEDQNACERDSILQAKGLAAGAIEAPRLFEKCMQATGYSKSYNFGTYAQSTPAPVSDIYPVPNAGGFTKQDFRKRTDATTGKPYYELSLNNEWQRSSLNEFQYHRLPD